MQVNTESMSASSESFYAVLSDIGQLLSSAPDPAALYDGVIGILERGIGVGFVAILERDRRSGAWHCSAPATLVATVEERCLTLPRQLTSPRILRGQCENILDCAGAGEVAALQADIMDDLASEALLPIVRAGDMDSALLLRSPGADFFSPPVVRLLEQVVGSIALGLAMHDQRARLLQSIHDESRQRRALRLLSEMIKMVTHSADEGTLLAGACELTRRIGGYPVVSIKLFDTDVTGTPAAGVWAGFDPQERAATPQELLPGPEFATVIAEALASGAAQVATVPSAGRGGAARAQLGAQLALPLHADDGMGVLVIGAERRDAFGAVELQIFSEMAIELGLGIRMHRARAARCAAEQQLRSGLEYFRTILSKQYAGILVISEDLRVVFANAAFCALFDLPQSPGELEGLPAQQVYLQIRAAYSEPEDELSRIQAILERGEAIEGEQVAMAGGRTFLRDFTPISIDGVPRGWLWHQRDITEQKSQEERVAQLAFYDALTGLPNRRLLFDLLDQARARASAQGSLLAVGVLDLDRFKSVNDTVGHAGGDLMLTEVTARIVGMLRKGDVLARLGGDEFALMIEGLDNREQLDVVNRYILQALRAPFDLMGEQIHLSASIGWTLFPLDAVASDVLLRHADLALYAAKDDGKDRGSVYEPAMEQEQIRLQAMRERIAQALQQSRLCLLFQPIVYIDGLPGLNGVAGMEALLRLDDCSDGLVEPAGFMHVLDDPQLARPIGRYVLDEALKCCQAWLQASVSIPVSVNISTRHLLHPAFFTDIDAALEAYPAVMEVGFGIEITETGPMMDNTRASVVIEECRRRGIRVGLDDFGTGSASLSHIQQLDIEHIKLDQSFVRDIVSDERNMAIAAGVITTARMLAKTVIAEGVETCEQGDLLASLGCHQLQGFSIARPMPCDAVAEWVQSWVPPASWTHLVNERQSLLTNHPGGE